jgi:NADPH:quinone reductase-like Zn-dependent oxidoreductase
MGVSFAAIPTQQQAIVQTGAKPDTLEVRTVPVLEPGERQVLIRVYAAAVNQGDMKGLPAATGNGGSGRVIVPGGDVAGVVEKLGPGVTALKSGEAVFAVVPKDLAPMNGAYSHFVLAPIDDVVAKPGRMTYAQAAGLGIASVTGVRAVNETQVARGERVLITGVAGGVGSAAAQAAKARGAYVIGTATPRHDSYVKSLGVDEIIDYSAGPFEARVKDMDVVIDTVGGDTADRAMTTLKKPGRYLSVAAHDIDAKCAAAGIHCLPRGTAASLSRPVYEEVASMANAGTLKIKIDTAFPLEQAAQAQTLALQGHAEGKIVLIVDAAKANRR